MGQRVYETHCGLVISPILFRGGRRLADREVGARGTTIGRGPGRRGANSAGAGVGTPEPWAGGELADSGRCERGCLPGRGQGERSRRGRAGAGTSRGLRILAGTGVGWRKLGNERDPRVGGM
jgi:hypothetical protein